MPKKVSVAKKIEGHRNGSYLFLIYNLIDEQYVKREIVIENTGVKKWTSRDLQSGN